MRHLKSKRRTTYLNTLTRFSASPLCRFPSEASCDLLELIFLSMMNGGRCVAAAPPSNSRSHVTRSGRRAELQPLQLDSSSLHKRQNPHSRAKMSQPRILELVKVGLTNVSMVLMAQSLTNSLSRPSVASSPSTSTPKDSASETRSSDNACAAQRSQHGTRRRMSHLETCKTHTSHLA